MITIKRIYDRPEPTDGTRFLVERLWPRGMKRDALHLDGWLKEVAPSDALRRWFGHDPAKWPEFQRRYFAELDSNPEAWRPIKVLAARDAGATSSEIHERIYRRKEFSASLHCSAAAQSLNRSTL